MTIRIGLLSVVTLVLLASSASAQGRPVQQVVLSPAVVNSMAVNKSKSKTSLGARVGMVRRSSAAASKAAPASPTSVREISGKK